MNARRAPSTAQAVAQTLSVIYSLCSFIAPYLPEWPITFVLLLPTYYLWAITLKQVPFASWLLLRTSESSNRTPKVIPTRAKSVC